MQQICRSQGVGLPTQLQEDFLAGYQCEPMIVTRASCDVSGADGLTWLASEGTVLVCYSRPAGGEFSRADFRIAEASELAVLEQDSDVLLQARFPQTGFVLRLPSGEAPALRKLAALHPPSDAVDTALAPALLTPALVCAAAVFAMVQADGQHAQLELDWVVARFGHLTAFRRGGAWVTKHGSAALIAEADRQLDLAQKECLLFNLLELGFADNRLTRAERAMVEQWQQALGVSEERYGMAYEALLARAAISTLVNETTAGPDWLPMNLLCACMLAVIRHRPESRERRLKYLERRIGFPEPLNNAKTYLDQLDSCGVLSMLPHLLSPLQLRCVVLNVLGEAYFDGIPGLEAGAFIQDLREASGIAAATLDRDTDLFRMLGARSIFHETAGAA